MTLGQKQELFSLMLSKLIAYIYERGYQVRMGDVWAHDRHKKNSNHFIKLAGDLNLFRSGEFFTTYVQHKQFGEYWEALHPLCRWGGRFKESAPGAGDGIDSNHYSIEHNGRM